jgi:hypothetical protein
MSITAKRRQRDGRTVYEVRLRDPGGKEYSRTFETRKAGEAHEVEQRTARARGGWVGPRPADIAFSEVARTWLSGDPTKRGSGLHLSRRGVTAADPNA